MTALIVYTVVATYAAHKTVIEVREHRAHKRETAA